MTKKETGVKKKEWKDRNSPLIGDNKFKNLEKGDNRTYLTISMELMNLEDIDLTDIYQVKERIGFYFRLHAQYDLKPTVTGLCMALNGIDRRRLWEIKTDVPCRDTKLRNLPREVVDLIKKSNKIMENMWENYMLNNKIQPVAGIFLGKNYYGMKDTTELTVSPSTNDDDYSADDIRQRYLEDKRLSTIEDDDEKEKK